MINLNRIKLQYIFFSTKYFKTICICKGMFGIFKEYLENILPFLNDIKTSYFKDFKRI
jgi:hypothetical protein